MGFSRRFTQGVGRATRVAGLAEAASSWGWEAAGDDAGSRPYRVKGPPLVPLRLLAPLVVVTTVLVFGSGM